MPIAPKTRSLLIIIAFILILILPVCYAVIREIAYKQNPPAKTLEPVQAPVTK